MGVRASVVVFFTPLIIQNTSYSDNSSWVFYLAVFNFALLLDGGFTPTFTRHYAYSISSEKNPLRYRDIFRQGQIIYLAIALLSCFVLPLFLCVYGENNNTVAIIFVLIVASLLYQGRYVALLEGSGFIQFVRKTLFLQSVSQVIVLSICLALNVSQDFLIVYYICPTLITTLVFRFRCSRLVVGYDPSKSPRFERQIIEQSLKTGVSTFLTIGTVQAATIFYSQIILSNDESVSVLFSLMLIRQISNFAQVPFYTRIPQMANLYAKGSLKELRNLQLKNAILSMSLLSVVSTLVIPVNFSLSYFGFITLPIEGGAFWWLLILAFVFERGFAIYQHCLAVKNFVAWHKTAVVYCLCLSLTLYFLNNIEHPILSLPISIFVASLLSLCYLRILVRRVKFV